MYFYFIAKGCLRSRLARSTWTAREFPRPANSCGPYIFLCFCVLMYLLVSAMTSSSDKLGPLFNCICGRFGDQEMLLAVLFVGKSILQGALKQFGLVTSIQENRGERTLICQCVLLREVLVINVFVVLY